LSLLAGEITQHFDQVWKGRFLGPFKVLERKGPMGYRLVFPNSLRRMHDVFHVSVWRHYVSDTTHVIEMSSLQVLDEGVLMMGQIFILDHCIL
jgi:hypothetical protein